MGVTGVRSRFVCVAGGLILIALGLFPKMAALVESLPTVVLGGAGLVMFGMVAATGIRILSAVDFQTNRNNLFVVAVSVGIGMIPLIAPNFKQWMPHGYSPADRLGDPAGIDECRVAECFLQRRESRCGGNGGGRAGGWRALTLKVLYQAPTNQWAFSFVLARHDSFGQASGQMKILARLAGIEPTTLGFGGQYSIH